MTKTYHVLLQLAEEGGFNVSVPVLPGCHTQGDTFEEAVANAREAIELSLACLMDTGQPVPAPVMALAVGVTVETTLEQHLAMLDEIERNAPVDDEEVDPETEARVLAAIAEHEANPGAGMTTEEMCAKHGWQLP